MNGAWKAERGGRLVRQRIQQLVLAGVGFGVLAWMVSAVGVDALIEALRPIGLPGFGVVVAVFAVAQLPSCIAWRKLMPSGAPLGSVLRVYVIGDALNLTVPSADTAGELAKVLMLRRWLPWGSLTASVTVHRVLELVALSALLAVGLMVSWFRVPLSGWWQGTAIAMLVATLGLVGGFFVAERRVGLYGPLLRKLLPRLGEPSQAGANIDRELRACLSRRWNVVAAGALVLASWVAGVGEVYVGLWLLGLPARLDVAIVVDAFGTVASNVAFFVPGRLGVSDGGRVLLLTALGVPTPGALAFAMLRRAREVTWAGVGFGLLLLSGRRIRADSTAVGGLAPRVSPEIVEP